MGWFTWYTYMVLARYIGGMINSTESSLEISGEIGLGDPAMTGMAYGLVCGLYGARRIKKMDVRPNFKHAVADGEIRLVASLIPVAVFMRTARAAFHPAVRRVWFALLDWRRTGYTEEV